MSRYAWAHEKVANHKGRATEHECSRCGGPATDWAYDGLDPDERTCPKRGLIYSVDPRHYYPLCRSCHVHVDKGSKCKNGHEFSEENTYLYGGHRYCKTCRVANRRRYLDRIAAAKAATQTS